MTKRLPSLSDKLPRQNDPTILAMLRTPMIQPVCWIVSDFAERIAVGVHAAQLQKTDPPINSITARSKSEKESAALNEADRLAPCGRWRSRMKTRCTSMAVAAIIPTAKKA